MIWFLRGIKNALSSVFLVSNLMALFLVFSLVALVWYTIVAGSNGSTTAIIGFSSGIIGTITGFYFNKDQLAAAQREQSVQGELAAGYSEEVADFQSQIDDWKRRYDDIFQLLTSINDENQAAPDPDVEPT